MTRWWFILLAVVLGWFTPAHAFAHTRAIAYDVGPSSEKVVSVAGITMDTDEGNQEDPLSLHKYLYTEANPVNHIDPSGHDDGDAVASKFLGNLVALGIPTTLSGLVAAASEDNTCGPDVTAAIFATAEDVESTWIAAGPGRASAAALEAYSPLRSGGNRWWDVQKLNDVGQGDTTIDFGNGSSLGTGLIGKQTVQFTYPGGRQGVFYGGSVNYFLWGKIFCMAYNTLTQPLTGGHDPAFNESAAVAFVRAHKLDIGSRGTDYEKEAIAFTKLGFSGANPSSTALPTIKPSPGNVGSSSRFLWKWLGLHDTFQ